MEVTECYQGGANAVERRLCYLGFPQGGTLLSSRRKCQGDQEEEDGSEGTAQARAFIGVPWERPGRAGRIASGAPFEQFQRALGYRHCP